MRRVLLLLAPVALLALAAATQGRSGPGARAPAATTTAVERFASVALQGPEQFAISLPPGYAGTRRRYPVVYLLHGLPDDGTGFAAARVRRLAAEAAARGRPVIVVAPQGARTGDTDPEWHDWGPGRNWETAVAEELVARVDAGWRTIPDRRSRALIGISAGGYGAAAIGLHRPETFSVLESWSGYFRPTTPDGGATLHVGTPAEDRAASAHSFVGCLARIDRRYRPRYFGFYVGSQDPDFVDDNERLHAELDTRRGAAPLRRLPRRPPQRVLGRPRAAVAGGRARAPLVVAGAPGRPGGGACRRAGRALSRRLGRRAAGRGAPGRRRGAPGRRRGARGRGPRGARGPGRPAPAGRPSPGRPCSPRRGARRRR